VPDQPGAVEVECPDPGALIVRTQAVRAVNYFDERYGEFGSDLELYTRAFRASKKIEAVPSIRALCRRGDGLWSPESPAAESALNADYGIGLAAYTSKHYGWLAGFRLKTRMIFHALIHFRFGLLSQLLNGQKIDGSQRAL
jgi:GT2 family glycosyltransferase